MSGTRCVTQAQASRFTSSRALRNAPDMALTEPEGGGDANLSLRSTLLDPTSYVERLEDDVCGACAVRARAALRTAAPRRSGSRSTHSGRSRAARASAAA